MSQYLGKSVSTFDRTNNPTPADERSEILAWLSPLDPRVRHQDLQAQRVENVGNWLLQTEQFRSWCGGTHRDQSDNATLFCYGDPGVGKTYISSLVIDTLCEQARRQNAAVACFYVDFAARGEQSPTNILGALLKQLVRGLDEIPGEVIHAFRDREIGASGQALKLADIVKLFRTIAASQRTILCIDALDECSLGDRLELLTSLGNILRGSSRTQLFLTGRSHIRSEVEGQLDGAVTIVSVTTRKGDVIKFLCAKMDEDPAPDAMDGILETYIAHVISETLSTTFLMASLNIDGILRETTVFRRRQRLDAMTDRLTLEDTYGVSLERIRAQDSARSSLGMAVLMWVYHSERPLHVDELCHALAIEIGSTDLESGNVPSKGTLLGCCQGLVIVDRESSTTRLIHSSLQEYFYTHSEYFANSHSTIAETCLTYLNSQQVKDLSANPSPDLRNTPFLSYASRYWGIHAKMELSENAKSLALQLFNQYDGHVSARLLLQQVWSSDCVEPDSSSVFTGLHCACLFGITEVVDLLVGMKGRGINQRDWVGVTPLIWAAMYGHQDVVKLLLGQEDIDPSIPDRGFGRTALSWAKGNGHERVVDLLLGWEDVGPSTQDGQDGEVFQKGIRLPFGQSSSRSSKTNSEPLHCSSAPAPVDDMDTFAELGSRVVPWHWMSIPQCHDSRLEPVTSPRQRDPLPSNQSDPNFGFGSISDAWPVQIVLPGHFEQDSAFGLSNSSSACYTPPLSSPGQDSTTSLHSWNNIDLKMTQDYADNSACYFSPPSSSGRGSTTSLHDWNNIDFKLTQGYGSSQGQELYPDSGISSLASLPRRPGSAAHFACDSCAIVFKRQADLRRHMATARGHVNPSGIVCPESGCKHSHSFTRVDNFRVHYCRQHEKTNDEVDAFIAVWRAQGIGNGGKKGKAWGVDNLKTHYGVSRGKTEEEVDAFTAESKAREHVELLVGNDGRVAM